MGDILLRNMESTLMASMIWNHPLLSNNPIFLAALNMLASSSSFGAERSTPDCGYTAMVGDKILVDFSWDVGSNATYRANAVSAELL